MSEPEKLPPAMATWTRDRIDNQVRVLSSPDARGRVEVEIVWSATRHHVHKEALHHPDEVAARLLAMGDRPVEVARPPIPRKPPPKPLPAPPPPKPHRATLPGARIDRDLAARLFPGEPLLGVPVSARLRLLGGDDGRVFLRAYDQDGMIRERPYIYRPPESQIAIAQPGRKGGGGKVAIEALGKNRLYKLVHPDLGVPLGKVSIGIGTANAFGGM